MIMNFLVGINQYLIKYQLQEHLTFSWLMPNKKYRFEQQTPMVNIELSFITGSYEEVFPLDIYPLQILESLYV